MDPLEDLCSLIGSAICDDPPLAMKEGGIIRDGYSEEVDRLRNAKTEGKDWLAKLEEEEREKTGIKNLRIRYNKVFGYYLEVTNSFREPCAGLLYAEADTGQRRALYHAPPQRAGRYDPGGGGQAVRPGV